MRYKIRIGSLLLMLTLLLGIMFIPFSQGETYQAAATSYTNAKAFYESTGLDGLSYHADAANGSFYIATCSKLASTSYGLSSRTSGHLMYRSLGYDITLFTDDGYEVSFSVKRDGSIEFMEEAQVNYGGYQYDLWCISTKTLYDLAIATNVTVAEKVLSAPIIHIKADAIMATVLNGEASGYIEEIEKGDISIVGTVYRLKDKSKLYDMRDMFSGHDFDSYYDIVEQLENYELQIRYSLQGTDAANLGCTSVVEVSNTDFRLVNYKENGVTTPYVLYNKAQGKIYTTACTVLNRFSLLNPETIGLSKKGYHLIKGKEWIFDNVSFSANSIYEPKDVCADAGFRNRKIYMYANWQRNEYTIEYNANGGRGTIPSQKMYYDKMGYLTYNSGLLKKTGYYLPKGQEWKDAYGNVYSDGEAVKNLTSTHKGTVVLFANWKPSLITIINDKQGGSGGTDAFYQMYGVGFYNDISTKNLISKITIPSKTGYTFTGYYNNIFGLGEPLIKADGSIVIGNTTYTSDATIYAGYEAMKFAIIFDMQGGVEGTVRATATYDQVLPSADAPTRDGYTFKGYYTGENGTGEKYYNEYMTPDMDSNPDDTYKLLSNITLYAYWVDESAPTVTLTADYEIWTNRTIVLTVDAYDKGVGIKSIQLFKEDTPVKTLDDLSGIDRKTFTYENTTEGAVVYKAVAVDMNNNEAESYVAVKYDNTAPKGTIKEEIVEGNKFTIVLDTWDTNPDNP